MKAVYKRSMAVSNLPYLFLFVIAIRSTKQVYALVCDQKVLASSFTAFPSPYQGIAVINPTVPGCDLFRNVQFRCDYSVIIGDSVQVPTEVDLTNNSYIKHFIAWRSISENLYVDFAFTGPARITAIQLSFLNSPQNHVSLPYLQLHNVTHYAARQENDQLSLIPSFLLDNSDLQSTDNLTRTVSLQPITPLTADSGFNLRIAFSFSPFHDFDTLLLNEVTFCSDTQPVFTRSITFFDEESSIVQPSAEELRAGYLELVCSIITDGQYNWQWLRNNTVISGSDGYGISISDASRTSRLRISSLNFNDAGQYQCNASTMHADGLLFNSSSIVKTIQFPEYVITKPDIVGTTTAILDCELHGYQSSLSPPMWFFSDSLLTNSSKYSLSSSEGMKTIILENGTILPSVIVSLTIHNLSVADGGEYSCRGARGGSSLTTLTVIESTEPPSQTVPPTTAITTHGSTISTSRGTTNDVTYNTGTIHDEKTTDSNTVLSNSTDPTALTGSTSNTTVHLSPAIRGIIAGSLIGFSILIIVFVVVLIAIVTCARRRKSAKHFEASNPSISDHRVEVPTRLRVIPEDKACNFELPKNVRIIEKIPVMDKESVTNKVLFRADSNNSTSGLEQSVIFSYFTDL